MTTTATQPRIAQIILPSLGMAMRYAEALTKDVPAEKFAHLPVKNVNHAAWCIGHLSLYAERIFELVGRGDLASPDARFVELFKAGTPCVDEPGRYPAKDVIVTRFRERWERVQAVLPEIPEERFFAPNPLEGRMRELLPTVGAAVNFLCSGHHQMHLGQVSAWRRLIGLGSVM